jgi:hypothetical protein
MGEGIATSRPVFERLQPSRCLTSCFIWKPLFSSGGTGAFLLFDIIPSPYQIHRYNALRKFCLSQRLYFYVLAKLWSI